MRDVGIGAAQPQPRAVPAAASARTSRRARPTQQQPAAPLYGYMPPGMVDLRDPFGAASFYDPYGVGARAPYGYYGGPQAMPAYGDEGGDNGAGEGVGPSDEEGTSVEDLSAPPEEVLHPQPPARARPYGGAYGGVCHGRTAIPSVASVQKVVLTLSPSPLPVYRRRRQYSNHRPRHGGHSPSPSRPQPTHPPPALAHNRLQGGLRTSTCRSVGRVQ